ncbi:hypothetical protein CIB48_g7783 [Xylaria polymorpha]|nr:hypothetical protein CIB48_g7783 [Xylaria polymorpha]
MLTWASLHRYAHDGHTYPGCQVNAIVGCIEYVEEMEVCTMAIVYRRLGLTKRKDRLIRNQTSKANKASRGANIVRHAIWSVSTSLLDPDGITRPRRPSPPRIKMPRPFTIP